jgi:hypothetical protein
MLRQPNLSNVIVCLDSTPVPTILADLYRVEGKGISPIEIGTAIADAIKRLAKRKEP